MIIVSLLYTILACKRFPRNALLLEGRGNPYGPGTVLGPLRDIELKMACLLILRNIELLLKNINYTDTVQKG